MPDEPQDINQPPQVVPPTDNTLPYNEPAPYQSPNVDNTAPVSTPSSPWSMPSSSSEPDPYPGPLSTPTSEILPAPVDVVPIQTANLMPRKNRRKLIIGIVVAVVIVLICGLSAFAITSWYQNPQKVITDSLIDAITAKTSIYTGTIKVDDSSNNTKLSVDITTKQADATGSLVAKLVLTAGGKDYSVSGNALVDKSGDIYFKVENLGGIVTTAKASIGIASDTTVSLAVDNLVKKIDGTWIRISSVDLKQYNQDYSASQTCLNDTVKKFKDDKAAIAEVTNLYRSDPFIVVDKELGQTGGSFGYQIKQSNSALKAFANGLQNTKVYKSLHGCDNSFVINENDIGVASSDNSSKDNTFKLWVSVWTHQITRIELNGKSGSSTTTASLEPKYNQTVDITAPAKSITLADLKSYIDDLTKTISP